jgi:hypothetical protein
MTLEIFQTIFLAFITSAAFLYIARYMWRKFRRSFLLFIKNILEPKSVKQSLQAVETSFNLADQHPDLSRLYAHFKETGINVVSMSKVLPAQAQKQ